MVFLDRVLEDHPDFDSTRGNQTPTTDGKRKTMAGRAKESEQEFIDRLRKAKEQADNVKTRGDSFTNQYRQRKKARMATMAAEGAIGMAQRRQEISDQPDDQRSEGAPDPQPQPEGAEPEQSQASSMIDSAQDPERQPKQSRPRELIKSKTSLKSTGLNSR